MKNGKISVVVPFFNAQETLLPCICALEAQTLRPLQIILVDNNSGDESARIAKEAAANNPELCTYILEERQGPSFARNTGARLANGDFVAFTDSDCVPDRSWLHNVVGAFGEPRVGAVAGKVRGFRPRNAVEKFHSVFTMPGPSIPMIYNEFTLSSGGFPTANLSVRKNVMDAVGGFDERMEIYSEDYDLCARVYKAGYRISYVPEAVVYHQHRNSLAGTWRQGLGFGKGHAALLKRHFAKMVIIDLPRIHYRSQKWPLKMWLDMQGPDKRVLALALLSFIWWPFMFLWVFYFLYLFYYIRSKLEQHNLHAGFFEKWQMMIILLAKSFAISLGRIVGAIRNRVMCL
jgi:GT2 family glycosyltransferase